MLKNKVIVVTGGAGLIGRQFCSAIAEHGGMALVADRDLNAASVVATEISERFPGHVEPLMMDITDKDSILQVIQKLQDKYQHVDAVVNNAYPRNRNYGRKLDEVTYQDFCENLGLHLGGYFLVAQQFGLFFKKQGYGNILNMSSIYGLVAPRFDIYSDVSFTMPVEYAAIKSGVNHLTKYLAEYFKKDGVRVNCLSPGGILDKQAESFVKKYNSYCGTKGMLDSKDLCGTLVFLLSDASKYITGQNLVVDDGFTL